MNVTSLASFEIVVIGGSTLQQRGELGHHQQTPSADPVPQPLFRRRRAGFSQHARVLGVVLTKVTDGLVARAVVTI
jgi:hypothetical protein